MTTHRYTRLTAVALTAAGIVGATTAVTDSAHAARTPSAPVTLDLAGWDCEFYPVDDKGWCTDGEESVSVVWRAARFRSDFIAKAGPTGETVPMLGGTGIVAEEGHYAIGPRRRGIFVTVQGGTASPATVAEVAGALDWTR